MCIPRGRGEKDLPRFQRHGEVFCKELLAIAMCRGCSRRRLGVWNGFEWQRVRGLSTFFSGVKRFFEAQGVSGERA
jgi:hypothetical protein